MGTELVTVNNNLVVRDTVNTWRWYDAFGPNVQKWGWGGSDTAVVSTTTMAGATVTPSGGGHGTLVAVASDAGGGIAFTPDGTDDHGIQVQALSESFYLGSKWPCYFGCRFTTTVADQTDILAGLAITDTSLIAGTTHGVYFLLTDESAILSHQMAKTTFTTTPAATLVAGTYATAEWFYDGANVSIYINGALVATIADTNANFPNTEHLTPSFAVLNGAATAKTVTVSWLRCIQVQAG